MNIKPNIENDVQDRSTRAWQVLCNYVDELAQTGEPEFSPAERLGPKLFAQIHTLPESISKLEKVTKMWLYGSQLKRIPPEIGLMKSLKFFDPYTSYHLHWFPYEITYCKNLKDSRISTRALFGNIKYRNEFPNLKHNPVRYHGDQLHCSICQSPIKYEETNQLWISLRIATDVVPLLVNSCSTECESKLPIPPENYVPGPHKGGRHLQQPMTKDEYFEWQLKNSAAIKKSPESEEDESIDKSDQNKKGSKIYHFIRKLWDK